MLYFRLITSALFPVVFSLLFFILEKKTPYKNCSLLLKQIVAGIVFGIIACLATQFGIPYDGYVMNVRSAAPLTAGLLFGGPAGIISGVIGGIYRWISVYWGIGEYTKVACSLATVLAGIIGTVCRKFMFDNKKTSWFYGFFISITTEVIHMLLVFVTHMDDIHKAFTVVKHTTLYMVIANAVSVMLSLLILSLASKGKNEKSKLNRPISRTFSIYLFISVLIAYCITSIFTYDLQNNISSFEVNNLLSLNINDVKLDIEDTSDNHLLEISRNIKADIENNYVSDGNYGEISRDVLSNLALKYNVTEINIVNGKGIIHISSNQDFDGFDMSSVKGGQAEKFLCLLDNEDEYVQKYQPQDYDKTVMRKYAGIKLDGYGFIQVGYDNTDFRNDISKNLSQMAKNRHVGKEGFIFILNSFTNEVVSCPDNSVDAGNIKKFTNEITKNEENKVTAFESIDGVKYYCMFNSIEGYTVVGCIPVSEADFSRDASVYIGIFMQIIVFSALFVLVYFLIKKIIVDNIHKINISLAKITGGDLNTTVNVRGSEEFSSLSDDINSTVQKLKDYIKEAEERIDKELEFAKTIQYSALPSVFPPYPNRDEFDIYASMSTAKEVGGDFYDFYLLSEDKLAFLIADVSGKGIPAAMFMMTAKTMLKSYAESGLGVSEILTHANEKLCENNDAGMFVTCWMGVLDLNTGVVKFANAGHNPPLIKRKDGNFEFLKSRAGFVLAGMDSIIYKENEITLNEGDEIYLYTDGVTEATDKNNELFDNDRLTDVLNREDYKTAKDVCLSVKSAVDEFAGEADQFDDITMLSLKFNKKYNKEDNV